MATRNRGRGVAQAPRQARLAPVLGRRSAPTVCRSKLRSFKPVSWAAVRRLAVPAFKARGHSRPVITGANPSSAPQRPRLEPPLIGRQQLGATYVRHPKCWLTLRSSRDLHRQAAWPAHRPVSSSAARAKHLPGSDPSAQTLGVARADAGAFGQPLTSYRSACRIRAS
jgi:hypothetical protein